MFRPRLSESKQAKPPTCWQMQSWLSLIACPCLVACAGLPASERTSEAARLLEDVKLTEAAGVRAGSYSGGMKRRLSVAIALLGDPQVTMCCQSGKLAGCSWLFRRGI